MNQTNITAGALLLATLTDHPKRLTTLLKKSDPETQTETLNLPGIPETIYKEFINTNHPTVAKTVIKNTTGTLQQQALQTYSKHKNANIRQQAAESNQLPETNLQTLLNDSNGQVRQAALTNSANRESMNLNQITIKSGGDAVKTLKLLTQNETQLDNLIHKNTAFLMKLIEKANTIQHTINYSTILAKLLETNHFKETAKLTTQYGTSWYLYHARKRTPLESYQKILLKKLHEHLHQGNPNNQAKEDLQAALTTLTWITRYYKQHETAWKELNNQNEIITTLLPLHQLPEIENNTLNGETLPENWINQTLQLLGHPEDFHHGKKNANPNKLPAALKPAHGTGQFDYLLTLENIGELTGTLQQATPEQLHGYTQQLQKSLGKNQTWGQGENIRIIISATPENLLPAMLNLLRETNNIAKTEQTRWHGNVYDFDEILEQIGERNTAEETIFEQTPWNSFIHYINYLNQRANTPWRPEKEKEKYNQQLQTAVTWMKNRFGAMTDQQLETAVDLAGNFPGTPAQMAELTENITNTTQTTNIRKHQKEKTNSSAKSPVKHA